MKKVSLIIQSDICNDYYLGMKYKDIKKKYGVNRWNIQAALSRFDMKTNRIKSHPRLPGSKKMTKGAIAYYHDGDYLPPIKPNKFDPVLEADLDIMERMDNVDDTGEGSYEMVIDDNGKVRYEGR